MTFNKVISVFRVLDYVDNVLNHSSCEAVILHSKLVLSALWFVIADLISCVVNKSTPTIVRMTMAVSLSLLHGNVL